MRLHPGWEPTEGKAWRESSGVEFPYIEMQLFSAPANARTEPQDVVQVNTHSPAPWASMLHAWFGVIRVPGRPQAAAGQQP
eukprot:459304-Alexandrium_andersonii.AAC.1